MKRQSKILEIPASSEITIEHEGNTPGYDGHCLRAYAYFKDQMPDINPEDVVSINSISVRYPDLRQRSKGPTFALTFMGTSKTLQQNFGFLPLEARQIEQSYHELYKQSDAWQMDQVRKAQKAGYVELAFGLRLRTPLLPRLVLSCHDTLPMQGHKEMKTAVNALTQSYGLLNTRAANEFMQRVWDSKWRDRVLPIMQIHDSQYYLIEASAECLEWVNRTLIECMRWNGLPEIQHPSIGLEAELEIYWPTWAESARLSNNADQPEIIRTFGELRNSYGTGR